MIVRKSSPQIERMAETRNIHRQGRRPGCATFWGCRSTNILTLPIRTTSGTDSTPMHVTTDRLGVPRLYAVPALELGAVVDHHSRLRKTRSTV